VPEEIGVVLVPPALGKEQDGGAKELPGGMDNELRAAGIGDPVGEPAADAQPLHDLPQKHCPGVGGQAFLSCLDADGPVEGGAKQGRRSTVSAHTDREKLELMRNFWQQAISTCTTARSGPNRR
jgi:hypothetical protein